VPFVYLWVEARVGVALHQSHLLFTVPGEGSQVGADWATMRGAVSSSESRHPKNAICEKISQSHGNTDTSSF